MRPLLVALTTTAALAVPSFSQTVVPAGSPVVVTTHGLFVPSPVSSTPLLFASAAAIAGTSTLQAPAIEWELGTDAFLVTSGARLFRVTVTALGPGQFTVTDLTPASAQPLNLFDLDLHPGTGELFLLDQTQDVVLRYAPPFAAGMSPVDAIPVAGSARAIAIDARAHPNAIDVAESSQVTRVPLDGSAAVTVASLAFASGLDHDVERAGVGGTFVCAKGSSKIGQATGGDLLIDMNYSGFCSPLVLAPVDIEWNSLTNRAFVLAEDGVNPQCFAAFPATGPNHVMRLTPAQGPIGPSLATFAGPSGITGVNGDLAVVVGDFAYIAAYGESCAPSGGGPVLDIGQSVITPSSPSIAFELTQASPGQPAALMIGGAAQQSPLPSGCVVLVVSSLVQSLGTTNAQGELSVSMALGPLPQGLDFFVQAVVGSPSGLTLSEALAVHVGP
jgi:hypothetical protein